MKTTSAQFNLLFLALFCLFVQQLSAQCIGESIQITNSSFEGFPSKGIAPSGWIACQSGQSPDIQPGNFAITLAPSQGNTYAGFYYMDTVFYPNQGSWQEGLSQELTTNLISGTEYHSSIDLSNSSTTDSQLQPGCAELEIWGGYSACDHQELLWHSGDITNYDSWVNYPVVFTPTADFTFISIQIKGLGCSGMPYILADNFAPLVAHYQVNIKIIASQDSVCTGNTVSLLADASNGTGYYTYNWNNPSVTSMSQTITINETTTVTVTATDSNGCISAPASLSIYNYLPLSFQYTIPEVCENDSVVAKLFAKGGDGDYQFRLNNINITGNSIKFKPTKDSVYIVTLTDGCGVFSDTIEVKINEIPTAAFSFSNLTPLTISFNDLSTISNGKITGWEWSFGDLATSDDQAPVYNYKTAGTYQVTLMVTSDKGCNSLPEFQTVSIKTKETGINEEINNVTFQQPNSVYENIAEGSNPLSVVVFNMTGIKMAEIKNPGKNIISAVQALSLPSGTYVYSAISNETIIAKGKIAIVK